MKTTRERNWITFCFVFVAIISITCLLNACDTGRDESPTQEAVEPEGAAEGPRQAPIASKEPGEGGSASEEHPADGTASRETSVLDGKVMRYYYYEIVLAEAKSTGDEKPKPLSPYPPGIWASSDAVVNPFFGPDVTIELRFGHLTCTWTTFKSDGSRGLTGTQPCIQVEIEPGIYQVTWMESNKDTVTMSINLNAKRVTTSYRHSPGPVLELGRARILEFGPASEMGN